MRLRPLSEAEAYARCYGDGDENVRATRVTPRTPRHESAVSGESLREAFEQRLDGREPAEPAVSGRAPAAA